eukprot:TRINITY_DN12907_c0_g1_i2.p1 TRINITY_DN12907_c0_g1~~TRINITY_DN12907_c0_g1_i2.p1  ORF type:complete len:122 (-),score=8.86 TRINITY_DN12907_c0_g1_i2:70-435(-)
MDANYSSLPLERFHSSYTFSDQIGIGASSLVYKAVDKLSQEGFAVKVMAKAHFKQTINREITALEKVKGYPNGRSSNCATWEGVYDRFNFIVFQFRHYFKCTKTRIISTCCSSCMFKFGKT